MIVRSKLFLGVLLVNALCGKPAWTCEQVAATIVISGDATCCKVLAAREVQRYVYLRSGQLPPIARAHPAAGRVIVIRVDTELAPQQYRLKTAGRTLTISGGSDLGALYGAYHFARTLGVDFALHGDILPEKRVPFTLPELDEVHQPLFELRGILPFHDFAEGPDWWEADDYKAYLSQMAKMRMNFLGLHAYPDTPWGPEPTIWLGLPDDVNPDGTVKFSYPASYHTTGRLNGYGEESGSKKRWWGYSRRSTSDFTVGASRLFAVDNHGSAAMAGHVYEELNPEACNEVFNASARLLGNAFRHARGLGIQTAVGTELPLQIPPVLRAHLRSRGFDPDDPATRARVYQGMLARIERAFPVDYYWAWTDEGWLHKEDLERQERDLYQRELDCLSEKLAEFSRSTKLATCGWVLGPKRDRALFDKLLPKTVPVSCINRWLGASRVDAIFSEVHGRSKWAIPWLEDDTGMIVPQLWAGRLRRDAADALAYKCTGLFGIHWRTKVLEPNFAVLAEAAWAQPWVPDEEMVLDAATRAELPRDMPCEDFYRQWCSSRFGCAVADRAAAILARMDGGGPANPDSFETAKPRTLPLPAVWIDGPGAIQPNPTPWSEEERRYGFVAELERLETAVQGVANQNRYAYWVNTFRLLRALGKLGCMRGELDRLVDRLPEVTDPQRRKALAEEALVLRVQLARQWEQMMTYQLACTDTPGAMGTIANLEQHSLGNLKFITKHDVAIADAIDRPLPERVHPTKRYLGRPRLIVPTVRSSVDCGEALSLKVIVLDNNRPKTARLHWRWMGQGEWKEIPLIHVARGVHTVTLPPATKRSIEYYLTAVTATGAPLIWPPTAPAMNQTVVVMPVAAR